MAGNFGNCQPFEVQEVGLEPTQPQRPRDFKSLVSTIPPFLPVDDAKLQFFFCLRK